MRFQKRQLIPALLVSILVGCDSSSGTATPEQPAQNSSRLVAGQKIDGILPEEDSTLYTFVADSGQTWTFVLASKSLYTVASVADSSGAGLALHHYDHADSIDDVMRFPCDRSGTYTLAVTSQWRKGGSFTLQVSKTDSLPSDFVPRDKYEIDGTAAKARTISDDSVVQDRTLGGFDNWAGDIDAIAMQGDSGRTYTFRYRSSLAGSSVGVYMSDSSYWPEISSKDTTIDGEQVKTLTVPVEKTARYHFVVKHGNRAQRYRIALTSKAGLPERMVPDKYENDDILSKSTPIATDSTVQRHTIHGNMYDPEDVDWVSFHADSGWTYTLNYSDFGQSGYYGRFFASDSTPIGSAYNVVNGIRRSTMFARRSGTFHIRFQSTQARTVYQLALSKRQGIPELALADAYEDDGRPELAKPITPDSSWQKRTLHGWSEFELSDTDHVAFEAVAGTTYRLYLVDSTGFMDVAVFDKDTAPVSTTASSTGVSALRRFSFVPRSSGTCRIRLATDFTATVYRIALVAAAP